MFDTIFFDWGGVIAEDPGDEFLGKLLRDVGANDAQVEEIYDSYTRSFMRGEITEDEYWKMLSEKYGFKIHDSISDEFKKWRGLIINKKVFGLVDKAKENGIKTAMLSNIIEPTYKALLETGYLDKFDKVIASCRVGFAKPQKEIYKIALATLDTTANRSVFIDDKQKNLDPAASIGFTTILAQNSAQVFADISKIIQSNKL